MKKIVLGAVVAVLLATPCILYYRVMRAERQWAETFAPLDQWPARLRTQSNDTAVDLSDWSERLLPRDQATKDVISKYQTAMDEAPAGLSKPEEFLAAYHREDFDEFAGWAASQPPPVFQLLLRSVDDPLPNRLSFMNLERTITSIAMARAAAGDRKGAEQLMDAAWQLNDSMRKSPLLIYQLIALAAFRYQLGALRKIDVDAAKWLPRLESADFIKTLGVSLQAETWSLDESVRENVYTTRAHLDAERAVNAGLNVDSPYKPQWLQLLRTPVRWLDLPGAIEARREVLVTLEHTPRSEHIDAALDDARMRGYRRWWSLPDPDVTAVMPVTAFRRAVRVMAERELTEKIIAARSIRRATGAWPRAIDGASALADERWLYERTGTGAVIRLNRPMDWGDLLGLNVPLQYDLR